MVHANSLLTGCALFDQGKAAHRLALLLGAIAVNGRGREVVAGQEVFQSICTALGLHKYQRQPLDTQYLFSCSTMLHQLSLLLQNAQSHMQHMPPRQHNHQAKLAHNGATRDKKRTSTVLMRSRRTWRLSPGETYSMCCTMRSVEEPTRPTARNM